MKQSVFGIKTAGQAFDFAAVIGWSMFVLGAIAKWNEFNMNVWVFLGAGTVYGIASYFSYLILDDLVSISLMDMFERPDGLGMGEVVISPVTPPLLLLFWLTERGGTFVFFLLTSLLKKKEL